MLTFLAAPPKVTKRMQMQAVRDQEEAPAATEDVSAINSGQ